MMHSRHHTRRDGNVADAGIALELLHEPFALSSIDASAHSQPAVFDVDVYATHFGEISEAERTRRRAVSGYSPVVPQREDGNPPRSSATRRVKQSAQHLGSGSAWTVLPVGAVWRVRPGRQESAFGHAGRLTAARRSCPETATKLPVGGHEICRRRRLPRRVPS